MTKKSHYTVVLILLVMFVLLAGCIEKEKKEFSTPTPTSTPTSTPKPSIPPTADKINLSTSNKINLSMDYNGRQIELINGQTFNVTLETNPSTGYSWEVIELNNNILHQIGEAETESNITKKNMVGVPVMQTFQFEIINKGDTTLKLVYRRLWEKDVAPVNSFSIDIIVR